MYTIWHTGHQINEEVTHTFYKGSLKLSSTYEGYHYKHAEFYNGKPTPSISYGILRGTGEIFRDCMNSGIEWWEIDRGYFKPDHFKGYYRISMNGLRAKYNPDLDLPSDRMDALRLEVDPWRKGKQILLCPPSEYICSWGEIDVDEWIKQISISVAKYTDRPVKVRLKSSMTPLEEDLKESHFVIGYNSNVIVNGLLMGVPGFNTTEDIGIIFEDIEKPINLDREKYFKFLSYSQFTLEEFESGRAWRTAMEVQKYGTV